MILNKKPLYGVIFSGHHFDFHPTMEAATEAAEKAGFCPFTGLDALVETFEPGELELVGDIWWFGDRQLLHKDAAPWLS